MRAAYEAIHLPETGSIKTISARGRTFTPLWHFHPELELKFVEHSRGLRFVGDSVMPFRENELVLIGPNLPHVWISDPAESRRLGHARACIAQFPENFLGSALNHTPEFANVHELLRRSRQGLLFEAPVSTEAAGWLRDAATQEGVPRLLSILRVLDLLARTKKFRVLASVGYEPKLNQSDAARINTACRYVQENLTREISRSAVAAQLRMNDDAFSRFFHQKMGNTFSHYVNHLRIARAVHHMTVDEMTIAEACFASGFNNLSNFNRRFRDIKRMAPREYLACLQAKET